MEIGTLNQRIIFLENRVVTDEIGNHTAVWDEAFSCWAKVTLKASSEHTDAGVTKEHRHWNSSFGKVSTGCRL